MEPAQRPTVIVMTPVRNEAWILGQFVACASLWADHIIIADQMSDDGSRALVAAHPKVTVVENHDVGFSEVARQQLLIEAARKIPGPRLLVALDADEVLSANVVDSAEWRAATHALPGTVLAFGKVELYQSIAQYCAHSGSDRNRWMPFAYVDDGAPYAGTVFHSSRVPVPPTARWMRLNEVAVLHYNCINLPRLRSKNRWYRCFERLMFPEKSVVAINRVYGWLERRHQELHIRPTLPEWFAAYRGADIEVSGIDRQTVFWWDWEVLRMFGRHGVAPFRHLDIWSVDWEMLRLAGHQEGIAGLPGAPITPPMRWHDRWLRAAIRQSHHLRPRVITDWGLTKLCDLTKSRKIQ